MHIRSLNVSLFKKLCKPISGLDIVYFVYIAAIPLWQFHCGNPSGFMLIYYQPLVFRLKPTLPICLAAAAYF